MLAGISCGLLEEYELFDVQRVAMSEELAAYDPYALPPEDVQEPPRSIAAALLKIGPGIILAGTIVGSGELILTTSLGAKNGFVFLWLILFSCVIKVFVQVELGRYAISSGKPTLGALNELPGRIFPTHWLVWWWFGMMLCTVMQLGGMTGGVGQVLQLAFPGFSEQMTAGIVQLVPVTKGLFAARPEMIWAIVTCLAAMLLIYHGGYRRIEWLTTIIVVSVTTITMLAVAALAWTDYAISWNQLASGFRLQTPPAGMMTAFAVFGITGVGATELFYYPYWCLEKGYARFVGRYDGSPEWEARAKGWIKVMQLDAWVSMVVFTISTVAFYLLGAAVLHPQGLHPEGSQLINTLANMYAGPFGQWTRILFLVGAGAVLFKTLYLACAANSRLAADFVILAGAAPAGAAQVRLKFIQRFCLFFPILALVFYFVLHDPKLLVQLGGIAQAITLPMIAAATIYFRYQKIHPALQPSRFTDGLLWVATIAIFFVASMMIPQQFRELSRLVVNLF